MSAFCLFVGVISLRYPARVEELFGGRAVCRVVLSIFLSGAVLGCVAFIKKRASDGVGEVGGVLAALNGWFFVAMFVMYLFFEYGNK